MLIGAGDACSLAAAGLGTLVLFAPAAALVLVADGGLVGLWLALGVFLRRGWRSSPAARAAPAG